VVQDVIYPPPEGWEDRLYIVVKPSSTQPTVQAAADEFSQLSGKNNLGLS